MILDYHLKMSDAQAITASAATTNYIDTTVAGKTVEKELYLVASVNTAFGSAGGTATLTIAIQSDDDSAFGSPTTLFTSPAFTVAALVAGFQAIKMRMPVATQAAAGTTVITERYLRAYYTVGTENFNAGKLDFFLVENPDITNLMASGS
jgi:hypothetical protein